MTTLSGRGARWSAALLLLLGFGVLFWAPFLYDDAALIFRNPLVVGPWPGWRAFFFGSYFLGEYEPLNFLLHRLLWTAGGSDVFLYRLTSFALHAANAALAYRLYRRLLGAPVTAWWTALLVALYPGHAEVLAISTFKKHLLVAFFSMAALNAQDSDLPPSLRWAAAWLATAAALGSRESGAMVPFLAAALAWTRGRLKRDRVLLAGEAAVVAGYGVFRLAAVPRHFQPILEASWLSHFLTCGKGLLWDVGQLVVPTSICLEHSLSAVSPGSYEAVLVVAGLAGLIFCCRALRRDRVAVFGAAWTFIALFPTLNLVPFSNYSLVANRYLYLASFGFYLLWARLALRFLQPRLRQTRWQRVTPPLVAAFTSLGAVRAASIFCDPVTLWRHTAACAPENPRAHGELGRALESAGRFSESENEFQKAIALDPDYLWGYVGLSSVDGLMGKPAQAVAAARRRLALKEDAEGWFTLGMALAGAGRPAQARGPFEKAVALDDRDPRYHLYLGACYRDLGRAGDARAQWSFSLHSYDPAVAARAADWLAALGH